MSHQFRKSTMLLITAGLIQFGAQAQGQLIYQNNLAPDGGWCFGWDGRVSQPIQLGAHDSISSVTMSLYRSRPAIEGTLAVDVYSDNNGIPGDRIATLGTLDADSIVLGEGKADGRDYLFANPVSDLSPNQTYHVVAGVQGSNYADGCVWWLDSSSPGSITAPEALAAAQAEPRGPIGQWLPLRNHPSGGPPFSLYQTMIVRAPTVPCDFNADGTCNLEDLNRRSLYGIDLVEGSNDPVDVHIYDITGDSLVNTDDLDAWLVDAAPRNGLEAPYLPGDTNLDGAVDFNDFLRLADNFSKGRKDWSDGDFNGDKTVNFTDFLVLAKNFSAGRGAATAAVPEPTGVGLAMFGVLGLIGFRGRR